MLFSAAMMTALFAACTNEEFVDNSQKFDTSKSTTRKSSTLPMRAELQ